MKRWKIRFAANRPGKTRKPISARNGSTNTICVPAITSITSTPIAIGRGLKICQAASMSACALDSNCPEGWAWCQLNGRRRYWRVTRRR